MYSGWNWGDPHIQTLDGKGYTFNGLGEYVLLEVRNGSDVVIFEIQARTAAVNSSVTGFKATVFSAVVAKDHVTTASIQVELPEDAASGKTPPSTVFDQSLLLQFFYS